MAFFEKIQILSLSIFGTADILENNFFSEKSDLNYNINLVFRLEINPDFILRLKNGHNKICHIFQLLRPSIKLWIKIPKNALNVFIKMQESIDFQLVHHEIPQ